MVVNKKEVSHGEKVNRNSGRSDNAIRNFWFNGGSEKASKYTEEEHIQRVTERIQKRFIDTNLRWVDREQPTAFEVFPLYNENDELKYFLVEFEPYGFLYILLRDEQMKGFSWLGASTSMYKIADDISGKNDWSPYKIDETNSQPSPDTDKIWMLNENDEKIVFNKSPYAIADCKDERRYLLTGNIPSAKRDEKFVNLISMEEIEFIDGQLTKKHACVQISIWPKNESDL